MIRLDKQAFIQKRHLNPPQARERDTCAQKAKINTDMTDVSNQKTSIIRQRRQYGALRHCQKQTTPVKSLTIPPTNCFKIP